MKKSMKKLTALLLAMVMVLAMGITSFAATPDDDGYITVPVKVVIEDMPAANKLPEGYTGPTTAGVLFEGNITFNINIDESTTAMDFIDATNLAIQKSSTGEYISTINGLGSIDLEYTEHSYKGYSWMIDMKAGSSVEVTGTRPTWAEPAPVKNAWFSSPLAASNVEMNGEQYFPYDYYSPNNGGFTTSVEGIIVKYVLTETTW